MANARGEEVAAYMREYYRAHSTRPPMIPGATRESKKCRKCGETKPRADFTIRQSGPRIGHLSAYCKPCSVIVQKKRTERDPSIYRRVEWPSKLRRLYGITVDDYNRMLTEQGGACAVCGTQSPGGRAYKKIAREMFDVDHCHKTGAVRGLLCGRCNRLVGLAGDSAETALKLADYLRKGA